MGAVCISQRHATYQSKIAFMISGAGDKILKRWPLAASIFVQTSVTGSESSEVLKLGVSHNVRGHDKDINTLAVSPNDAMAASGTSPLYLIHTPTANTDTTPAPCINTTRASYIYTTPTHQSTPHLFLSTTPYRILTTTSHLYRTHPHHTYY